MAQKWVRRRPRRSLVQELKLQLDLSVVNRAESDGDISANQAVRLREWITNVLEIRENPLAKIAVLDDQGNHIGVVTQFWDGSLWLAQPYGATWPAGEVFPDVVQAMAHVHDIAAENPE